MSTSKNKSLLDIGMHQIARQGWVKFSMASLAEEAGVALATVHLQFPSKYALLDKFIDQVDQMMLEDMDAFDQEESKKDRLFSVVMTRFDALEDYKGAIRSLHRDGWKDPLLLLHLAPKAANSMLWMLQAAGYETNDFMGIVRVKVFGALLLAITSEWLRDQSEDLAKTMAAADKYLQRMI